MQTAIDLCHRLTHRYVGSYQHLDRWAHVGSAVETGRQDLTRPAPDDVTEPTSELVTLRVHVEDPTMDVEKAIRDTMTVRGCAHEHDCCGCRSTWVGRVRKVSSDLWCAEIQSSRNY